MYALQSIYKLGLLILVCMIWRQSRRADIEGGVRSKWGAFLLICVAVVFTGWVVGFRRVTLNIGVLFLFLYGFLFALRRGRFAALVLFWPLLVSLVWLPGSLHHDSYDTFLPYSETRLREKLVCRAYLHHFDSIRGTRLVLEREGRDWFRDDIVDEVVSFGQEVSCAETADGHSILSVRYNGGTVETRKAVKLPIGPVR